MDHNSSFFLPSFDAASRNHVSPSFWFMLAVLVGLFVLAYETVHVDHPILIMSISRALYVDEGFYSDAAQNFAKFGRWGFHLDFPHWSSDPLVTFFQSLVFYFFGASLETARMLSVSMSVASALVFYSLLRMGMRPFMSMLLTISGILTFNFLTFSRSAFTDPTSTCLALLALLSFARIRAKNLAIVLSVGFAFLAFLSKLYFLHTLAAVVALWIIELVIIPAFKKDEIQKRSLILLGVSVAVSAAFYMLFLFRFGERLSEYIAINTYLIPYSDVGFIWAKTLEALHELPYDTKAHVYLWTIVVSAAACLVFLFWPRQRAALVSRIADLTRAELALCLWLIVGLLAVGIGQAIRPHYHFFAILPLVAAGAVALKLVLPPRLQTTAICTVAVLHLLFQGPYYLRWADRSEKTSVYDASREIVRSIYEQSGEDPMIPVIGEYAAQLGLYGERIFSLDAKWTPSYSLCERVMLWKPRFHVNVVWPKSRSHRETDWIAECPKVEKTQEIARFPIFMDDELVLSRIDYAE